MYPFSQNTFKRQNSTKQTKINLVTAADDKKIKNEKPPRIGDICIVNVLQLFCV